MNHHEIHEKHEKIAVQNGAGDEADLQKLEFTNLHPVKTQGHALKMVASKNVSNDVIQQWQTALDELKSSGRYNELIQKYLIPANTEE